MYEEGGYEDRDVASTQQRSLLPTVREGLARSVAVTVRLSSVSPPHIAEVFGGKNHLLYSYL